MGKEGLEKRLAAIFDKHGWKLVKKLECKETSCCIKAREKIINYLIGNRYLSYSPKGNYGIFARIGDELHRPLTDSKGNVLYFTSINHANRFGTEVYPEKSPQEEDRFPSWLYVKEVEPAAA